MEELFITEKDPKIIITEFNTVVDAIYDAAFKVLKDHNELPDKLVLGTIAKMAFPPNNKEQIRLIIEFTRDSDPLGHFSDRARRALSNYVKNADEVSEVYKLILKEQAQKKQ